ncbi:alanine racemase [bacterium]|nr:alanine racemase [Akkermansiaceae bacterium]MDB4296021.1 alanine racemase [bacterium]MDB4143523.1 alanine racemase [Akkermansiaceae bacterium]MDB4284217.1 alanine racemase [Akkermansiaceae bacterium]MDB4387297.1 alanine racemase [Akkermansiaceae bacterium]
MTESPPRAWAEIDFEAMRQNLRFAKQHAGGKEVMVVIKAGAYGHGLVETAQAMESEKPKFFGVANAGEARRLFKAGVETTPYILGATLPAEREEIAARGWTPCLCSLEEMEHFNRLGPVKAHLALDTGMGRGGFLPHQVAEALEKLKRCEGIELTGIGSHLPVADEDPDFTREQFEIFDELVEGILEELKPEQETFSIHLSNSAGLLDYESRTTNLIRPGLMLYGVSPLSEHQENLKPTMTLKTRVSLVQELPKGHGVSYGRTLLQRDTRAAVLGIGYGDGYPRALSDKGTEVMIAGKRCPLLGRVTMDQIIVDVTDLDQCESGEEAILFGQEILVSEIAKKAGTIPWEILTQITTRVERRYSQG